MHFDFFYFEFRNKDFFKYADKSICSVEFIDFASSSGDKLFT